MNKQQLQQIKELISSQITVMEYQRKNILYARKYHSKNSNRDDPSTKHHHDEMKRFGNELSSCKKKLVKLRSLQKSIKYQLWLCKYDKEDDSEFLDVEEFGEDAEKPASIFEKMISFFRGDSSNAVD